MYGAAACNNLRMPRPRLLAMGASGRRFYESRLSEAINAEKLMTLLAEHARPRRGERQ